MRPRLLDIDFRTRWLHLRNEGTLAASMHEFDKNSIRKVAVSGSPCRRSRQPSLGGPGAPCLAVPWRLASVRHGRASRRDLSATDTRCRRPGRRHQRARSTVRKGFPVRLSNRLSVHCPPVWTGVSRPASGWQYWPAETPGRSVDSGTLGRRGGRSPSRYASIPSSAVVRRLPYSPSRPQHSCSSLKKPANDNDKTCKKVLQDMHKSVLCMNLRLAASHSIPTNR